MKNYIYIYSINLKSEYIKLKKWFIYLRNWLKFLNKQQVCKMTVPTLTL